jgi:alkanesulfonate monooxygenase SsuD/methylene tetrahydromethanopterin reductase-like flavin-dependent oxidoreductase (luciferase family)
MLARKEYGRDIQVWANCYCVIGDTDEDALKFRDWYVREKGDWQAVDNLVRSLGLQSGVLPKEQLEGANIISSPVGAAFRWSERPRISLMISAGLQIRASMARCCRGRATRRGSIASSPRSCRWSSRLDCASRYRR